MIPSDLLSLQGENLPVIFDADSNILKDIRVDSGSNPLAFIAASIKCEVPPPLFVLEASKTGRIPSD